MRNEELIQVIIDSVNELRLSHQRIRYKEIKTPIGLKYINGKIDAYNEILEILETIKEKANEN